MEWCLCFFILSFTSGIMFALVDFEARQGSDVRVVVFFREAILMFFAFEVFQDSALCDVALSFQLFLFSFVEE